MRTLKGWITTTCLVAILMASTMTANAGIIIAGLSETPAPTPCTQPSKDSKDLGGIIIAGVGIIIAGFTGIIIAGTADEPPVDCGIIIAG